MRKFIASLLSLLITFLFPLQVFADQIVNNVDTTIDATAENINLITNGSNGTVGYWVNPTAGDGKSGCNLTGQTTLTVSVTSSDPTVATVSPSSITFTSCNPSTSPINVAVTPHNIGSATISLTQTANTTVGTFDLSTATYTVTVGTAPTPTPQPTATPTPTAVPTATPTPTAIPTATPTPTPADTTAPVIVPHVVGTLGNNNWYTSDVAVTWSVTDPESAISSSTGCGATNITSDTTGTVLTCQATSAGGTSSQSVTIYRDATAPTITYTDRTLANSNGWNNSDVTVHWSCTDSTSGAVADNVSQTVTTEGVNQSTTGTCTDLAGNTASDIQNDINIDTTKPIISGYATPVPVNGWNNTNVVGHFSCSETGLVQSGLDTNTVANVILSTEGENQSITNAGSCTDQAGNVADSYTVTGINIDKTAPVTQVSLSGTLGNNNWYTSDVTVTLSAIDNLSGVDTTEYRINGGGWITYTNQFTVSDEGTNTVDYRSVDVAGNTEAYASQTIKIDKTAPSITYQSRTLANGNGWNNTDVTVNWTCSDTISGVVDASVSTTVSTEGANQSATGTCTNNAGLTAQDTQTGINIDKTAPTLNPTVSPSPVLLNGTATATAGATDSLSGIATQSCDAVVTSSVGAHSVNCTATDLAGNTATKAANYSVNYLWSGFLQPINDTAHQIGTTTSIFKGGSTVPAKFQLKDAQGNVVQMASAPQWVGYVKGSSMAAPVDESTYTDTATGGSTYRWDSTAQQYIYNWSTKGITTGYYYRIGVKLDDGQTYFVNLGLK